MVTLEQITAEYKEWKIDPPINYGEVWGLLRQIESLEAFQSDPVSKPFSAQWLFDRLYYISTDIERELQRELQGKQYRESDGCLYRKLNYKVLRNLYQNFQFFGFHLFMGLDEDEWPDEGEFDMLCERLCNIVKTYVDSASKRVTEIMGHYYSIKDCLGVIN